MKINAMMALLCAGYITLLANSNVVMAADWPPETGAKVAGNTPELPTKLQPVNQSLETLLNHGAKIISTSMADKGPVVTLQQGKQAVICVVNGAGSGGDQNISTSRCYAMN